MTAIAIFVKTPGYSPIKTRLAASLGKAKAEQWHQLAAKAIADKAVETAIGPVYFAVAEDQALDHPMWSALPTISQGQGGLGARMHHVHTRLIEDHGRALLLGADTIQWQPGSLIQADVWLKAQDARLCIGPARDGGFWTFGSNIALPRSAWTGVNYSRRSTLSEFIQAISTFGPCKTLATLTDLDELQDASAVLSEARAAGLSSSCSAAIKFIEEQLTPLADRQ